MKKLYTFIVVLLISVSGMWADDNTPTFTATAPTNVTNGWYQIKWVSLSNDTETDYEDTDVSGQFVTNYAQDVTVGGNYYSLYLHSAPTTLDEHVKTFIYFEQTGDNGDDGKVGNLRSANGRYITQSGASSITIPTNKNYIIYFSKKNQPFNSVISSGTQSVGTRYSLVPNGKDATPYIGKTAANKYPTTQFSPVSLSNLGLQPWTVEITGVTETISPTNIQVTYNGSNIYGLKSVYNNGTFFIATGTTPTSSDFTAPTIAGETPDITVNSGTHTITVAYPLVNVTYQIVYGESSLSGIYTTIGVNRGDALAIPSTLKRSYCTYTYYTDAACSSEISKLANDFVGSATTIYVKCNYNGPFDFSEEGSEAWYLLTGPSHRSGFTTKFIKVNAGSLVADETPSKADGYQWAFIGNPYGFVMKNKGSESYISSTATMVAKGLAAKFNLYQNTSGGTNHFSPAIIDGNNQTVLNDNNQGTVISCYTSSTGAATFTDDVKISNLQWAYFTPYAVSDYAVLSFSFMYGGNEVGTYGPVMISTGAVPTDFNVMGFTTYTTSPSTIAANTSAITITDTWDGPFAISPSFSEATWYNLRLHNSVYAYPAYSSSENPNVGLPSTYSTIDANSQWAFVGDPFNGLTIYNKGAGSSKVLETDAVSSTNDGGSTYATLETSGTKTYNKWYVKDASSYQTNGFYIENEEGYALNKRSTSNLAYWKSGRDGGSSFVVINVPTDYTTYVSANIQPFIDNAGEGYFKLPSAYASAMNDAIAAAGETVDESEYYELLATLNSLISRPETGYYRIKNNGTSNYLAYGYASRSDENTDRNGYGLIATSSSTDAASVIKLTRSAGTYKISTQGLNVQSSSEYNKAFPASSAVGADWVFAVSSPGIVSITNAASKVDDAGHDGSLHEGTGGWNDNHHGVINWNASADNSKWVVEDATSCTIPLTQVGEYRYATLCLPFDVTISGANAYTLTMGENVLTLSDAISEVPAGTPVLLRGTETSATATINTGEAFNSGSPLECVLTGTYAAKTLNLTDNMYFLGYNDAAAGDIGFYWGGTAGDSYTLSANRAYLDKEGISSNGFKILFQDDDDVTAIVPQVVKGAESQTIYDLQGRKVKNPQKGNIYIRNGKTVLY